MSNIKGMKTNVAMEQSCCPITGQVFDTGGILMRKRPLKNPDDSQKYCVTGFQICPEAQEKIDSGMLAMVEIDFDKSDKMSNGNISPQGAYRLGGVIYIKRDLAEEMFDRKNLPEFVYTDTEMVQNLQAMMDAKKG